MFHVKHVCFLGLKVGQDQGVSVTPEFGAAAEMEDEFRLDSNEESIEGYSHSAGLTASEVRNYTDTPSVLGPTLLVVNIISSNVGSRNLSSFHSRGTN